MELFDWFTAVAQIINFMILLWLLKRFLYRPVLDALDQREKAIADQLSRAEAAEVEAKRETQLYHERNAALEEQRQGLLTQLKAEMQQSRKDLLEALHEEIDTQRRQLGDALLQVQEDRWEQIARRTQDEVFAIADKALRVLADIGLQDRIVRVFLEKLQETGSMAQNQLTAGLVEDESEPVVIRSAFDLSEDQQGLLTDAIRSVLGDVAVRFEMNSMLICGIELAAWNYKLDWSLGRYLNELQAEVEVQMEGAGE